MMWRTTQCLVVGLLLVACSPRAPAPAAPAPATSRVPPGPDVAAGAAEAASSAPTAEAADVVLHLSHQEELVVVLIDGEALGVIDDDATWKAVEKLLRKFTADHPERAQPSVAIEPQSSVDTKAIVRVVDKLIALGVDDVQFRGVPPTPR